MSQLIMPSTENRMKEVDMLIHEVIFNNQQIRKRKDPDQKTKFKDWKMPTPPERFLKHKNNDPL
jgi:hypothetical protein